MIDLDKQIVSRTQDKKNNPIIFILIIILQSVIYGIGNPVTKIAYESITPFWCLTFRFVLAFFLLAVITGRKAINELRVAHLLIGSPVHYVWPGLISPPEREKIEL